MKTNKMTFNQLKKLVKESLNEDRLHEMYGDAGDDYKKDPKTGEYLKDKNGRKIPVSFKDDIEAALGKVRGLTSRLKDNIMAAIFNLQPNYSMAESAFVDGQEVDDVDAAFKGEDKQKAVMDQIEPGKTILYWYYSYDCSMCHFVQVIKKVGISRLYVRPMRNKIVKGNYTWGEVVPDEKAPLGEMQIARVDKNGKIWLGKSSMYKSDLNIWKGSPMRWDASR